MNNIPTEELPVIYRDLILRYSDLIRNISGRIYDIEKKLPEFLEHNSDIHNLLSISGIGTFSAALIKSEIIDIGRFKTFNRLCAYAGLAPRISASANKIHHGPLNKNRRKNLQWILLENVIHFIKSDPKNMLKFKGIEHRKGYNTAKVALARDFLKAVYIVLKEKRVYRRVKTESKIQSVADAALIGV